jgi:hypothetical protein
LSGKGLIAEFNTQLAYAARYTPVTKPQRRGLIVGAELISTPLSRPPGFVGAAHRGWTEGFRQFWQFWQFWQ